MPINMFNSESQATFSGDAVIAGFFAVKLSIFFAVLRSPKTPSVDLLVFMQFWLKVENL